MYGCSFRLCKNNEVNISVLIQISDYLNHGTNWMQKAHKLSSIVLLRKGKFLRVRWVKNFNTNKLCRKIMYHDFEIFIYKRKIINELYVRQRWSVLEIGTWKVWWIVGNSQKSWKCQFSCDSHYVEAITILLEKGADPNFTDNRGRDPILGAIGRKSLNNSKILEIFLEYGLDLNRMKGEITLKKLIQSFEEEELNDVIKKYEEKQMPNWTKLYQFPNTIDTMEWQILPM